MGYIKDCLIVRGNFDPFTEYTSFLGEGLKEKLETMRWSVIDLCGNEATPSNVHYWLRENSRRISKAVIYFGRGYKDRLTGQLEGEEITVIDRKNVEAMTKYLDVFTFAPSTAQKDGIGEYAIECGCHSWFGYKDEQLFDALNPSYEETETIENDSEIYIPETPPNIDTEGLKEAVWSYVTALASREKLIDCKNIYEENCAKISDDTDTIRLLTENIRLINKYD